jgi:hypothetical protein
LCGSFIIKKAAIPFEQPLSRFRPARLPFFGKAQGLQEKHVKHEMCVVSFLQSNLLF